MINIFKKEIEERREEERQRQALTNNGRIASAGTSIVVAFFHLIRDCIRFAIPIFLFLLVLSTILTYAVPEYKDFIMEVLNKLILSKL